MTDIDWTLFATGVAFGGVAAALFFAGLGWGMRLALRAARPMAVLLPSAALRIALLLAAGWWVATLGAVAALGFALAFVATRTILVAVLRPAKGRA
ncbi:ATP synthase subunit AtpR [Oceaniglobus indicus]|uniref:ATP synthase subunit AtpR n=1 Tax=Oceaniglobus indicus TaxID=2047749 RepID=UPI000C18D451|nr:ATP synthase subunit AtpR [Oceaniglobus indicus]